MSDKLNNRKVEHINIINSDEKTDRKKYYFDRIRLIHRALPEIALSDVNPSTIFLGKELSFPLLISSMTGGDHDVVRTINRNLAIAAEEMGVAMGVGSQRVQFSRPAAQNSFAIRQFAPTTLLMANLGAVQLNHGFDESHCQQAIDTVEADAICLHLNPLQEAIQPEGDTNFNGLVEKIGRMSKHLTKPLILKEVGAGLSLLDVELAINNGIYYFDVAGSGGISWSRIENFRQEAEQNDGVGLTFQDWGNPTPDILSSLKKYRGQITIIASGGIRNGIDMVKAVILGANLVGLAKPFLKPAMESPEAVKKTIAKLKKEFTIALFLLGKKTVKEIHYNESLIANWDRQ
jgi:isopentenyl-diphosphate Delta-isomerase